MDIFLSLPLYSNRKKYQQTAVGKEWRLKNKAKENISLSNEVLIRMIR